MLTPGKLAGMKAVSDARGVIAAAAMDQRGSLQKALAKERGGEVGDRDIEEFKSIVTEVLTPHASAILLDPEWGIPASKKRAKNAGLLLAYEKTGYDKTGPGRLPDLLDDWSVRRLKEVGGDCIKILLYYTPDDPQDVNNKKHAWVERIGDECRANDIPFFLELVGYDEGIDEKGPEYARKKPDIVIGSMVDFVHRLEVRFRDCDPLGHVNNAVYFTYLEQTRFQHWRALWGFGTSGQRPDMRRTRSWTSGTSTAASSRPPSSTTRSRRAEMRVRALPVVVCGLALAAGCTGASRDAAGTVTGTYDKRSGKLTQLEFDRNRNGKIDTWTDMRTMICWRVAVASSAGSNAASSPRCWRSSWRQSTSESSAPA